MRRVVISAGLSALLLGLAIAGSPLPALAAGYDGHWSVLVVTEKGDCDHAYRYEVTVADGQVSYAGSAGINVSGTVSAKGVVSVNISGGSHKAHGSGRMSAENGAGVWQGAGSADAGCAGRWEAARR